MLLGQAVFQAFVAAFVATLVERFHDFNKGCDKGLDKGSGVPLLVARVRVFPFGVNLGLELASPDKFLDIADDRSARHPKFPGES